MDGTKLSGMGVEEGGTTKQVYDRLVRMRMKLKNYEPKRAHRAVYGIQKKLDGKLLVATDTQSDTDKDERESNWKKDESGEA